MAPSPQRFSAEQVQGYNPNAHAILYCNDYGSRLAIAVDSLDYSDARAVAKASGVKFEASNWRSHLGRYLDKLPIIYDDGGEFDEAPEAPEAPEVPTEPTAAERIAAAERSAEQVLADLGDLIGGRLDEDGVRRIAAEVVADATKGMRPTVVKIGDRPEVKIDGRPHQAMPRILKVMQRGMVPWLHGPAGTGKSTLARHLAEAMGSKHFGTISGAPMMSEAKIMGFVQALGELVRTELRNVIEFGGVFLFDEFDHAPPAVAKGFLNEILAARAGDLVSFPDGMVRVHEDARFALAANTTGGGSNADYDGNRMDESTMSRLVTIKVDYDTELEAMLAEAINPKDGLAWHAKVKRMRANIEAHNIAKVSAGTRLVTDGADLLDIGWSEVEAFDAKLGERLSDSQRVKVLDGITLAS